MQVLVILYSVANIGSSGGWFESDWVVFSELQTWHPQSRWRHQCRCMRGESGGEGGVYTLKYGRFDDSNSFCLFRHITLQSSFTRAASVPVLIPLQPSIDLLANHLADWWWWNVYNPIVQLIEQPNPIRFCIHLNPWHSCQQNTSCFPTDSSGLWGKGIDRSIG